MKILLLGSSGFIGSHVYRLLNEKFHVEHISFSDEKSNSNTHVNTITVITPSSREINLSDPSSLVENPLLIEYLQSADVIINTVGIMSKDSELMENIHHHSPLVIAKIFQDTNNSQSDNSTQRFHVKHCRKHWINLSALGADSNHSVAFLNSKGRGDEALLSVDNDAFRVTIARPSLVFGLEDQKQGLKAGASTAMFMQLAKLAKSHLPLPLPNSGNFAVQPVHVDDVAEGLVSLTMREEKLPSIINMTGSQTCTLAQYLQMLAKDFYQSKLMILPVPINMAKLGTACFSMFSNMISVDSLTMLEDGSVADCGDFERVLGREALGYEKFISV